MEIWSHKFGAIVSWSSKGTDDMDMYIVDHRLKEFAPSTVSNAASTTLDINFRVNPVGDTFIALGTKIKLSDDESFTREQNLLIPPQFQYYGSNFHQAGITNEHYREPYLVLHHSDLADRFTLPGVDVVDAKLMCLEIKLDKLPEMITPKPLVPMDDNEKATVELLSQMGKQKTLVVWLRENQDIIDKLPMVREGLLAEIRDGHSYIRRFAHGDSQ